MVSRAATGLNADIATSGAGGAGRYALGAAVGGAAEGAAQNVGSYISDVALENKQLSAEGFLASAGQGALWGGAAGGALAGVERGTIAARRMFPRSAVTKDVAQIAETTFRAQADDTLKAADEMQKAAESAVKDLRLRSAELNLEREKLRGATDAASRVRLKEIALEKAQISIARKAERAAQNSERAAKGLPDLPPEPMPQTPILDDVAPPTGPPGAVTPSLAGSDDLASRLAATKGLLDEGVPFADIGAAARQGDDLAIAAGNTAHEAGMLADDAARGGQDAAEKLAALTDDFAEAHVSYKALLDPDRQARRASVKDWVADLQAKAGGPAKYEYRNSFTGEKLGGGASVKTDRVRTTFDEAEEFKTSVYDRVRVDSDLDAAYDDIIDRAAQAADVDELKVLAQQAADVEEQIFDAALTKGGRDADDVARIQAARAKYEWSPADVAARRAEKLAVAEPGMPPLSKKMRAEQDDIAAYERVMRENQFGSGKTAGKLARELTAPKRSLADDILEGARAPAGQVEQFGMGRFIDDAEEAIRIVGDMERTAHALVTEMGPSAPPAMQKMAADYGAAIDDQARRMTEAMAAKADDAAQGMALMSLPKAQRTESKLAGRAADAAGALEMLQMAGDIPGLPSASDLPVIGPILSMYLKYRAVKSVWSRMGGRIAATAETKVATRSAEMRDKAAGIVDALLEATGKGAKAARKPVVVGGAKLLESLKHSLYPDGNERQEQKTPAEAVKARVAELAAAAANPDAVKAAVRRQVGAANPDVSAAIEAAVLRKLQYLQKHAPKQPPPGPLGSRPWNPSTAEMERFARRIRAAESPITVLEDFERGALTPEAAETLRVVYPAMFAEVQQRLLSRAAELDAKLPYQRVLQASLLFDVPLDASLQPDILRRLQSAHASQAATGSPAPGQTAGQPPAPSTAGPVSIARLYETSEMRRATRR